MLRGCYGNDNGALVTSGNAVLFFDQEVLLQTAPTLHLTETLHCYVSILPTVCRTVRLILSSYPPAVHEMLHDSRNWVLALSEKKN